MEVIVRSAVVASIATATLLAVGACDDSMSLSEFREHLEAAQACEPTDTCVVVNLSNINCRVLCETVVNGDHAEEILDLSKSVECDEGVVFCPTPPNPRCEAGRCVGY